MIDLQKNYSINARRMKKSVIRELLKLTAKPDIISFAGGLPAPETFPVEELKDVCVKVLEKYGLKALQYGPTEGVDILKDQLVEWAKRDNVNITKENILMTVASQQGLDLVSKIFIDPSDPIIVGLPTYLGGLSAFNAYGANLIGITVDENGLETDKLEIKLEELKKKGEHYKFVYVVPDFQNPTGTTMPEDRRKKLIELSQKYNFIILEDSPYRELRFEGKEPPSILSLDTTGNVISLHTFSKILAPGLRLGWIIAHKDIIDKLVVAKQSTDLCTPPITQYIAAEYMSRGLLEKRIEETNILYKKKKDMMIEYLEKYMPKHDEISWTNPEGGLFLWVVLPKNFDTEAMFQEAIDEKVAYIVGSAFDAYGKSKNCMRLNFSFANENVMEEGMKRLAKVIEKKL
ncbi:MAG: PLP-dependent aminotransferase family protein [bacterium]|nr:PLP-dependent aminotransferase family protein [bacterium]